MNNAVSAVAHGYMEHGSYAIWDVPGTPSRTDAW